MTPEIEKIAQEMNLAPEVLVSRILDNFVERYKAGLPTIPPWKPDYNWRVSTTLSWDDPDHIRIKRNWIDVIQRETVIDKNHPLWNTCVERVPSFLTTVSNVLWKGEAGGRMLSVNDPIFDSAFG